MMRNGAVNVLVVGGYGTVGSMVSEILAKEERVTPIICGRNASRAEAFADRLHAEWRTLDVMDEHTIAPALADVGIVINCFSGPFTHAPLLLPELAARRGIHYLDVAGSYEYAERFVQLNEIASENQATLITALGANPGIPGIALLSCQEVFDTLDSARILFVLGAGLDGISVSSLKELKHMMDVKPVIWQTHQWIEPERTGAQEYIGPPFEKPVYLGASMTRDLLVIPELINVEELSFWSGSQFTGQGLAMILGLKMGLTNTDWGAALLLKLLKWMGRSEQATSDALIQVKVIGRKSTTRLMRKIEVFGEENYETALAPAIVCKQLVEGRINRYGAFVPPEVVPATDFMDQLSKYALHCSSTTEEIVA